MPSKVPSGDSEQPPADCELADEARADIAADCHSFWRRFGCYILTVTCRDAFADPDSHAAAISYYRYGLPFHRIEPTAAPDGTVTEASVSLSESAVAEMWLHPDGLKAHPGHAHYYDFAPEDRSVRAAHPALWMFSKPTKAASACGSVVPTPTTNPFVAQFPTYFHSLETHMVDAGHFLPEEASGYVTAELLRFLRGNSALGDASR